MSSSTLLAIEDSLERMSGDRGLLTSLFRLFLDDAPKKIIDIEHFAGKGELYQLERTAHSLKGAAATVGATELCRAAAELELAAKSGSADAVDALRLELSRVCDQTLEAMRVFCDQS